MNQTRQQQHDQSQPERQADPTGLSRWTKALLAVAIILMVGGGVMWIAGSIITPDQTDMVSEQSADQSQDGSDDSGPAPGLNPNLAPGLQPLDGSGEFLPGEQIGDDPELDPPDDAAQEQDSQAGDWLEQWSPAVFRLGFSFFVGFCIAYAVRTFLRISLLAIGLVLLLLFTLQYFNVINVNWGAIESHYDTAVVWLREQTASFAAFVQGYLPSASAGLAGAALGFRKR